LLLDEEPHTPLLKNKKIGEIKGNNQNAIEHTFAMVTRKVREIN
jgi:hypothetical protein